MNLDSTETRNIENLVNAQHKGIGKIINFPNVTQGSASIKEETFEPKSFPYSVEVPVFIEPGEKVTIKIIREQQDAYTSILNDTSDITNGVNKSNFRELYNLTTGIVETNLSTQSSYDDKIFSNRENLSYDTFNAVTNEVPRLEERQFMIENLEKKRDVFEKRGMIFGLVIAIIILALPLFISSLSFAVVLPGALMFVGLTFFILLRRSERSDRNNV